VITLKENPPVCLSPPACGQGQTRPSGRPACSRLPAGRGRQANIVTDRNHTNILFRAGAAKEVGDFGALF